MQVSDRHMTPLRITEQEFYDHMEFCIDMCERNNAVWRIEREDGKAVMCVPIKQSSPIPDEVQEQVEEFKRQFMEENLAS